MSRSIVQKVLAAAFLLLSMGSHAQTSSINVVTSAVPFLRITPDARAGGMGDLGVATSPDANAQYYNLAKYPFATGKSSVEDCQAITSWMKSRPYPVRYGISASETFISPIISETT